MHYLFETTTLVDGGVRVNGSTECQIASEGIRSQSERKSRAAAEQQRSQSPTRTRLRPNKSAHPVRPHHALVV
jgi:hypothetical protein